MTISYLCLGSNSGERKKLIEQAVGLINLAENIEIIRSSALYETEPWGVKNQNWFVNAVVEIKTSYTPEDLLNKCLEIEKVLGRNRENEERWGERAIDIDIVLYGKEVFASEKLTVPHKHLHKRAFVLVPLLELIPNYIHPVIGKNISEIYEDLEDVEEVYLFGTKIPQDVNYD